MATKPPRTKEKLMSRMRVLITKFDIAAQDYAFMGSQHPDDHEAIRNRYTKAREKLEKEIEENLYY